MSDKLTHECGIALIRLLKPLEHYKEKYGTTFYGLNKMYLMLEKQHNRGQDGAGLANIKFDVQPGQRYISRVRSNSSQPIQDVFTPINQRINNTLRDNPEIVDDVVAPKKHIPSIGELYLGHVRSSTSDTKSLEHMHPFLRQNNWMHRNLLIAGNFSMTNTDQMFENLLRLGMHPKENADAVTVLEKIGHFLDDEVSKLYEKAKDKGLSKQEASSYIVDKIKMGKILKRSSKDWDGGYVIGGMFGHGDSFVMRDPNGIRPASYYMDDEIVVVASERPVIQTALNVRACEVQELKPGNALIIKKDGRVSEEVVNVPHERRSCSFERIYFSRGSDKTIYLERKELGRLLAPRVLERVGYNLRDTVFSYIPNTAETAFYGMMEGVREYLVDWRMEQLRLLGSEPKTEAIKEVLSLEPRVEKIAVKDVKMRTFITADSSRDDMVAHVYDVTYGIVKNKVDTLVIIDDSIVRGTTLKKSILKILDRLHPRKIIVVSSAPQIRYPDCYGIDMARMGDFCAFTAAIELLKDTGRAGVIEKVYQKCLSQRNLPKEEMVNYVKDIYRPFSDEEVSAKIAEMLTPPDIDAEVEILYQTVDNLHRACPNDNGDWYFTGDYPTPGGVKVVNNAFINYMEGRNTRAYC